ncbi:MAG: hypothetical protein ACREX3_17460, partial [Gammaproteobacteria bacterium]
QRPGLGSDFIASVRAGLQAILANPEINAVVHRNTRRALLKRFHTHCTIGFTRKSVVVVACMVGEIHCVGNPGVDGYDLIEATDL